MSPRPFAAMATAQHGLACWSRAWSQLAHGMMSAGMAQIDLARAMYAGGPADLELFVHPGTPQEAAHRNLVLAKAKFGTAMTGYRHASDELTAGFFAAAETLAEGMDPDRQDASANAVSSNVRGAGIEPPVARQ